MLTDPRKSKPASWSANECFITGELVNSVIKSSLIRKHASVNITATCEQISQPQVFTESIFIKCVQHSHLRWIPVQSSVFDPERNSILPNITFDPQKTVYLHNNMLMTHSLLQSVSRMRSGTEVLSVRLPAFWQSNQCSYTRKVKKKD